MSLKFLDAAFKILNPKKVPSFFRLNSNNAILEFLLEVTSTHGNLINVG